jgi:hypothetical protein
MIDVSFELVGNRQVAVAESSTTGRPSSWWLWTRATLSATVSKSRVGWRGASVAFVATPAAFE